MCGHCTERQAFNVLESQRKVQQPPVSGWLDCEFYLQEAGQLIHAMNRITVSARRKKNNPLSLFSPEVVLCRGLEVLFRDGFDSSAYQQLLSNPQFRLVLGVTCSDGLPQEFSALSPILGIEPFGALYNERTFACRDAAARLMPNAPLKLAAVAILEHYIQWWHLGVGLVKNDLDKRMEETGIMDPIEDISDESHAEFKALFRTFWYSLLLLGPDPSHGTLLVKLMAAQPKGIPLFVAHDLWLQRQAALYLYDLQGLAPFIKNLGEYRTSLLYYIDLKRGIRSDEKSALQQAVGLLPKGVLWDHNFDLTDWLDRCGGY